MVSLISGGGLNVVGQNHFIYRDGTHSVVVDCGKRPLFDEENNSLEWVSPRLDLLDRAVEKTSAMGIITHPHWDHIGAMDELARRMPVHMSHSSRLFLDYKYFDSFILPPDASIYSYESEKFVVLSHHGNFNVMLVPLPHSIPGTYGVLMCVGDKNIVHLGDFKFNGMYESMGETRKIFQGIRRLCGQIDCLVLDVLNSELPGFTPPEQLVLDSIDRILSEESRVIITFFATNVDRMRGILDLAQKYGRKVHISGRSMSRVYNGILKITDFGRRNDQHSLKDWDVLLVSGSQGEMGEKREGDSGLVKMARGAHSHIELGRGDVVVNSSRSIEGNEAAICETMQGLHRRDVRVITHHGEAAKLGLSFAEEMLLHVSGHEQMGGLQEVVDIFEPRVIVPFHAPPEKVDVFVQNVKTSARIARLQVGEPFEI